MPIIKRLETDMFAFSDVCDYMVNPVNLRKKMGAGLAAEFKRKLSHTSYLDEYEKACDNGDLRIGTIQIFDNTDENWGVISLPTKRHWADTSDVGDITRGLEALKEFLSQEKYRYSVVGMPMLGCGLGAQDYPTVLPLMHNYLEDLEAVTILSMSPERTDISPKYLTIVGPLDFGINEKQQQTIDWVVDKTLEQWNTSLSDYTGVISGGYPGVDTYICGSRFKENIEQTYVFRKTGKVPLVAKPNTYKNGVGANLHLGNLLSEVSEDVLILKPRGHNNNRLSNMQTWLVSDKEERERQGLNARRVAVFGEVGIMRTPEDVLIPQAADIPY